MMAHSFMSINQNMEMINDNFKQVTEWPVENEGEIDLQDEREQVSKNSTENVAGESAQKKSKESKRELPETGEPSGSEEHNNNETRHKRFFKAYRIRLLNKEKTGSNINETPAANTTTLMLQKPDEECDKKTMPSEAIKLELTWWIDNMVELSAPYHILYRCIPVWMGGCLR